MSTAGLDARLEADTHAVVKLGLCDVRLVDDTRFQWLVLVPRVANISEWTDLPRDEQHRLADEIDLACRVLGRLHRPHKLNVATLGNVVPQMHVHVIARFRDDVAWPAPVWGIGTPVRHGPQDLRRVLAVTARAFA